MGIEVTDVSFSIAKTAVSGSCGFCRVILNDSIAINRIRVSKYEDGYRILLPRSTRDHNSDTFDKPIVQLLNEEVLEKVTEAVLNKYHKLIEDHNGFYKRETKFEKKVAIN